MLSLEHLLRARLESIPGLKGVYGLAAVGDDKPRPTPCAYVVFDGAKVQEVSTDATSARLLARWRVVLAVKQVAQAADGAPAREVAQPLVLAVLRTLMGWIPRTNGRPLKLADCPSPDYQTGGLLYVALDFTYEFFINAQE